MIQTLLLSIPLHRISWTTEERKIIMHAVTELANDLKHSVDYNSQKHQLHLNNITTLFWKDYDVLTKDDDTHPIQFPPEFIVLCGLMTIYNLVDQFFNLAHTELSSHVDE